MAIETTFAELNDLGFIGVTPEDKLYVAQEVVGWFPYRMKLTNRKGAGIIAQRVNPRQGCDQYSITSAHNAQGTAKVTGSLEDLISHLDLNYEPTCPFEG